jgi:RimJ/RimL family protein N-acetyltransferase
MHTTLSIRACEPDDLQAVLAILSIPEVSQGYLGWRYADDTLRRILLDNQALAHGPRDTVWVVDKSRGHPIGYARLIAGDLSYFIHPHYWRQQVATQLLCYVFSQVLAHQGRACIRSRVFRENTASIKTLEKLGFRFAGLSWQSLQGRHLDVAMLDYELDSNAAPSFGQPAAHITPTPATVARALV